MTGMTGHPPKDGSHRVTRFTLTEIEGDSFAADELKITVTREPRSGLLRHPLLTAIGGAMAGSLLTFSLNYLAQIEQYVHLVLRTLWAGS